MPTSFESQSSSGSSERSDPCWPSSPPPPTPLTPGLDAHAHFPCYEDLFYRPPPRSSSRAYMDACVRIGGGVDEDDDEYDGKDGNDGLRYSVGGIRGGSGGKGRRAAVGATRMNTATTAAAVVDEQLRELMYEMRDWMVENTEEAYKRLHVRSSPLSAPSLFLCVALRAYMRAPPPLPTLCCILNIGY